MKEQDCEQLTLFPVDFPVSRSALPASEKENQMQGTYGQKCLGLSPNLHRLGSLLKTYLESCELPGTMFARRYTLRATRSGFSVMKLRLSVRRIDESAYFLWDTEGAADSQGTWVGGRAKSLRTDVKMFPTPHAQKLTSNCANPEDLVDSQGNPWEPGKKPYDRRTGKQVTTTLHDFVRMWPTPTCNDAKNNGSESQMKRNQSLNCAVKLYPTPQANSGNGAGHSGGKRGSPNLQTVVQLYPTPTTPRPHDSENTAGKFMPGQNQKDLASVVARTGGQLNPEFVEFLMNFPKGWTEL